MSGIFGGGGATITVGSSLDNPQGRLEYVSGTSIQYQTLTGDAIHVNGEDITIADQEVLTTNNLLTATGADSGGATAASGTYACYLSSADASFAPSSLRLSATLPSSSTEINGVKYLAATGNGANWRFLGYVGTDESGNFGDSETRRLICNWYNRQQKVIFICPGYLDNDSAGTTTVNSATQWIVFPGASGPHVMVMHDGITGIAITGSTFYNNAATSLYLGIGVDSENDTEAMGYSVFASTGQQGDIFTSSFDSRHSGFSTAGNKVFNLLTATSSVTTKTVWIDGAGSGVSNQSVDLALTYFRGVYPC